MRAQSKTARLRAAPRLSAPKPVQGCADPDFAFGLDLADAPETCDAPEPPPWRFVLALEEEMEGAELDGERGDRPPEPPDAKEEAALEDDAPDFPLAPPDA